MKIGNICPKCGEVLFKIDNCKFGKSYVHNESIVLGADGAKVSVVFGTTDVAPATDTVTVTLTYDLQGLFPVLSMYLVGDVPPMPQTLRAQAVVRI